MSSKKLTEREIKGIEEAVRIWGELLSRKFLPRGGRAWV